MPSHSRNTHISWDTMRRLNSPAHSQATHGDRSLYLASFVWNSIPNDDRCASSLLSCKSPMMTYWAFYFDHCSHVHGLTVLLIFLRLLEIHSCAHKKFGFITAFTLSSNFTQLSAKLVCFDHYLWLVISTWMLLVSMESLNQWHITYFSRCFPSHTVIFNQFVPLFCSYSFSSKSLLYFFIKITRSVVNLIRVKLRAVSHIVFLRCRLIYSQHYAPYEHIYIFTLNVEIFHGVTYIWNRMNIHWCLGQNVPFYY